jgi:hypothetical protein
LCASPLAAQTGAPALSTASRGTAGSFEFSYSGPRLRAKPEQTLASPMLVRIASTRPGDSGAFIYRLDFLGAVAGPHDLRDLLEHDDGSPATDLPAMSVDVVSQLPPNHGTDVYGIPDPPFTLIGWYREFLIITAIAWIAIPILILIRRALRRRPPVVAPVSVPAPSLADELRPLLEAAKARAMTITERGRLELLLYRFWKEHLGIASGTQAQAIASLRAHPQAGQLLLAVERWLHQRDRGSETADPDVASLLEPFRSVTLAPAPTEVAT